VTLRGRDAVVVIAADALDRLLPPSCSTLPFVAFMESLDMDGLDLTRERDFGRDVAPPDRVLRLVGRWIPTMPPRSSAPDVPRA
jgi:hypothetical protein